MFELDGGVVYCRHERIRVYNSGCHCLAVGHAFISDYTRCFRPDIPEEENHCTCGFPDHSFHHLLYDCPRHTQACLTAGGHCQWDGDSPLYLVICQLGSQAGCRTKPAMESCSHGRRRRSLWWLTSQASNFARRQPGPQLRHHVMLSRSSCTPTTSIRIMIHLWQPDSHDDQAHQQRDSPTGFMPQSNSVSCS